MSAVAGMLAKKMAASAANRAKKMAQNQARVLAMKAQNKAKQYAAQKARQFANVAKRQANSRISGMVQKHMGNNAASRALANKLKAHVSSTINSASVVTQNQIRAAPKIAF